MHQQSCLIREIEQLICEMKVISVPQEPEQIAIGTMVLLNIKTANSEEESWFEVAGYDDGDFVSRRISYNSPIGQALLGKEEEDEVSVGAGVHRKEIEILEILHPEIYKASEEDSV